VVSGFRRSRRGSRRCVSDEIFPGVFHWEAFHNPIHARVSSYYGAPAGIVIDPKVPEEGWDGLPGEPQQVVLTNGSHVRDAQAFAERFDIPVRAWREAIESLPAELHAEPFTDHDEIAPGVVAVHIGKIADDEGALHLQVADGAIAFADALTRFNGVLAFPSDARLGRKPDVKKQGLKQAFHGLLERDFDNLLFAHGEPLVRGGKEALRDFVKSPVGYPEFGQVL
jgi:hypothetical protein